MSTGLVAWYKFDETSGTVAADSSGSGNTAATTGTWVGGKIGGALTVTGTDAEAPDVASLQIAGSWTTAGWVNFASFPTAGSCSMIVSKHGGPSSTDESNYELLLDNGFVSGAGLHWMTHFQDYPGLTNYTANVSAASAALGTWYHLAGVYDSTSKNLYLYLNGVLVATNSTGATPASGFHNALQMGFSTDGACQVNGTLDDVRIWNRALNATEVAQLYSGANAGGKEYCYGSHKYQYCDATAWLDMPVSGTATGCTTEARWKYDTGIKDFKYSDGTTCHKLACDANTCNAPDWITVSQKGEPVAGDPATNDDFGYYMAVSGTLAIVAAQGKNTQTGAVYVFDISNPAAPVQKAKITAADGATGDTFGASVALSGTLAVIAAPGKNGQIGMVYIFDLTNPALPVQIAEFTGSDSVSPDNFGGSVAISGKFAMVGSTLKTISGASDAGAAYLFDISNPAAPVQKAEITDPATVTALDQFGNVAVYGNLAVIGASGKNGYFGAAYVYDLTTPTAPVLKATLAASDAAVNNYFGNSVSMSGTLAVITAYGKTVSGFASAGAVYVFDLSTYLQKAEITDPATVAANDDFGWSVAVSGATALVGARGKTVGSNGGQGAAYVYDLTNPAAPAQKAKLTASDGVGGNYFGSGVALSGNSAVVGAYAKTVSGFGNAGAAYIFQPVCGTSCAAGTQLDWTNAQYSKTGDPVPKTAYDQYSDAMAVSGNTAIIGAFGRTGNYTGGAYVVDLTNPAAPVQLGAEILPADAVSSDQFGASISYYGSRALISANHKTGTLTYQGAVYVYDMTNPAAPVQQAEIIAPDLVASGYFGDIVQLFNNGNDALITANSTNTTTWAQAYVYDVSMCTPGLGSCTPNKIAEFTEPNPVAFDGFGNSAWVNAGGMAVIGAPDVTPPGFGNGENATDALGQFASTSSDATVVYTTGGADNNNYPTLSALGFSTPYATALDTVNHRLFVGDTSNDRVLVYNLNTDNSIPASPGHTASYVLGQPNFTSTGAVTTQAGMSRPWGLAFDATNNRLFVADIDNNRVLVFNTATITNGMNAAFELGQPSGTAFTSSAPATTQAGMYAPDSLAFDATNNRLFVGEATSYRVTVFNTATITNGMNAAFELGQPGGGTAFTSSSPATSQSGMNYPFGLAYDPNNNRLFVSDYLNTRVLVFNTTTITNGMNAANELGQPSGTAFTSTTQTTTQSGMSYPAGLAYDATNNRLFESDAGNNRVMVFSLSGGITNGMTAANELGQPSGTAFTSGASATTQAGLSTPWGLAYDAANARLFVGDQANNRVMLFHTQVGPSTEGVAYIYDLSTPGSPAYKSTLIPSDGASSDYFGTDVSINNSNLVLVGSPSHTWTNPGPCGASPANGQVCSDGGVHAGITPDGNVRMETQRCDIGMTWSGISCTGTRTGMVWSTSATIATGYTSQTTGQANTASLAALSNADSPYVAAQTCKNLNEDGHTDWYLPASNELSVLYANLAAIGNFDLSGTGYWASTETNFDNAQNIIFSNGIISNSGKTQLWWVRCVRKEPWAVSSGAAYVFDASTPTAPVQQGPAFNGIDSSGGDEFGDNVSLLGTSAMIGAYIHGGSGLNPYGEANAFDLTNPAAPVQTAALTHFPDGVLAFGLPIVQSGNLALIGATLYNSYSGEVFIYHGACAGGTGAGDGAACQTNGACTSTYPEAVVGSFKYVPGNYFEYCDGTSWIPVGPCGAQGLSAFTNVVNIALSTLTSSNIVQIPFSVICDNTISITGINGDNPQFRICGDAACSTNPAWGSSAATVSPGQWVQLELTSNASANTPNTATLTMGTASTIWSVTTALGYQRVFVSSATYLGNLGTPTTASADCAGLATAAGLTGTWKAWIATATTDDPNTRFTKPTTPYKLVDGTTTIANNWTGLTSGTILHAINKTETGAAPGAGNVWTAVGVAGIYTGTVTCTGWTNSGGGSNKCGWGSDASATSTWTVGGTQTGATASHLYCFEQ